MSDESDNKILRIALVQNGKVVEERLMRSREDVTIGQSFKKNTLVVPVSDLPDSFPVFRVQDGEYVLNFTDSMDGKVSEDGSVRKLNDLIDAGKADKTSDGYSTKLSTAARGRVQIGEVAILFHFVTPPPKRQRPALPASMRGGWIKGLDPYLAGLVAVSALLQAGFVVFVQMKEWPKKKNLEAQIPDRFVDIVRDDEPKEDKEKKEPQDKESEKEKEGPPKEKDDSKSEPKPKDEPKEKEEMSPDEKAAKEAKKQRQVAKQVEQKTILGAIGSKSKDGKGAVSDLLDDGGGETSMKNAFDESKGITTSAGEKSGLPTSGSADAEGSGSAAEIGGLGKTEGAKEAQQGVETGNKQEQKVEARVNLKQPGRTSGTGKLDQDSISSKIKLYSSRIQSCYERHLKKDQTASGKVVVRFKIGRAGKVTQANHVQDTVGGNVGACVAKVIRGLRFPKPKGGTVDVDKSFVFQAGG